MFDVSDLIERIEILEIKKESVYKDDRWNRYGVPIKLSFPPIGKWEETFVFSYNERAGNKSEDRPVEVKRDHIHLFIRRPEDLEEAMRDIKRAVEMANEEADKLIKERDAKRKATAEQQEIDKKIIKKIVDKLDEIKF
jgi:hypothetical protein